MRDVWTFVAQRARWISSCITITGPSLPASGVAATRSALSRFAGPSAPSSCNVRMASVRTTGTARSSCSARAYAVCLHRVGPVGYNDPFATLPNPVLDLVSQRARIRGRNSPARHPLYVGGDDFGDLPGLQESPTGRWPPARESCAALVGGSGDSAAERDEKHPEPRLHAHPLKSEATSSTSSMFKRRSYRYPASSPPTRARTSPQFVCRGGIGVMAARVVHALGVGSIARAYGNAGRRRVGPRVLQIRGAPRRAAPSRQLVCQARTLRAGYGACTIAAAVA